MSINTKTIKNNSITGKKRKKIKTEIFENDGSKFFVDKQSLSINIQRIFVNSWEKKYVKNVGKKIYTLEQNLNLAKAYLMSIH